MLFYLLKVKLCYDGEQVETPESYYQVHYHAYYHAVIAILILRCLGEEWSTEYRLLTYER